MGSRRSSATSTSGWGSAAGSARYYYLADAQGKTRGGKPEDDDRSGRVGRPSFHHQPRPTIPASIEDEDHELWGLGTKFDDGAFLFVGQDAFATITTQEAILASIGWSLVIALIIAIAAGAFASRRFLSKIDAINVTQHGDHGRTAGAHPHRRHRGRARPLSANLNRLFDSNESLLDSLKQVTTNIAHDLRSPLSRLKQGLEASLQPGSSKEMQEQAITGAIDEADRLLAISTGLLRIAQIESARVARASKR
jgi:signal transduction histidine kinase